MEARNLLTLAQSAETPDELLTVLADGFALGLWKPNWQHGHVAQQIADKVKQMAVVQEPDHLVDYPDDTAPDDEFNLEDLP
jgi:hypothetical protein